MRERTKFSAEHIGIVLLAVILFAAHILRANQISMPIILADEFGSIANAAYLVGLDWSNIISHLGNYSFGGSMLYLPIFAIAQNTDHVYFAIVLCNALLICIYYFLVYLFLRRLYPDSSRMLSALLSLAASLYPSYICYAYTAMYETALLVTFAAAAWAFASYCRTHRPGYLYGLTAAMGYMIMVHMRTVGVVAVSVLMLLLMMLGKQVPKKHGFGAIALLAVLFGVFLLVKNYFFRNLWLDGANYVSTIEDTTAVPNTMASQVEKLDLIFSWEGIRNLLLLLLGQSFYLMTATMVMGVVFFYVLIRQCFVKFRHRQFLKEDPVFYAMLFLGLAYLAQLAISCATFVKLLRFDQLIYGRYTEYLFGLLFVMGFMQIKRGKVRLFAAGGCLAVYGGVGIGMWLLTQYFNHAHLLTTCNIVSMTALAHFWNGEYLRTKVIVVLTAAVYCGMYFLVYFPQWKKLSAKCAEKLETWFPALGTCGAALLFFLNGTAFTDSYIVPLNQVHSNYSRIGDVILENLTDDHVEYYNTSENHTLEMLVKFELLQYRLWDVPLELHDYEDLETTDAEIIVTDNMVQPWEKGLFGNYDILYYRGEIVVWERKDTNTLTVPATLFQTLCTDRTDWDNNTYISNGQEGYLICGTPLSVGTGTYAVTFDVELLDAAAADTEAPLFTIDVYQGGEVLSTKDVYAGDISENESLSLEVDEVTITDASAPCEFRVRVGQNVEMEVSQVQIAEERTAN